MSRRIVAGECQGQGVYIRGVLAGNCLCVTMEKNVENPSMSRWILADHCQGQGAYIMESLGGQLPLCDHGVKRCKTSMSRRILAGNCQVQVVYIMKGLGGQLPLCDHGVKRWKTSMSRWILQRLHLFKDALLSLPRERKRAGSPDDPLRGWLLWGTNVQVSTTGTPCGEQDTGKTLCKIIWYKRACIRTDTQQIHLSLDPPSSTRKWAWINVVAEHLLNHKLCSKTRPCRKSDHFSERDHILMLWLG